MIALVNAQLNGRAQLLAHSTLQVLRCPDFVLDMIPLNDTIINHYRICYRHACG